MVGALVALVSTLFTVAPAQADANGPVTLLPTEGSTFNTIAGSPLSFISTQDPSTRNGEAATTSALKTLYIISNPDEDEFTITYARNIATSSSFVYYTYDDDGVAAPFTNSNTTGVVLTGNPELAATFSIKVSASQIAIPAFAGNANAESLVSVSLTVPTTSPTVQVTVQTLVDYSTGTAATKGVFNATGFDRRSSVETVNFYAVGSVTATTVIRSLVPGTRTLSATVVYGSGVNPYFVEDSTTLALFKDGVRVTASSQVNSGLQDYASRITSSTATSMSAGVITFGRASNGNDFTADLTGGNIGAGVY